jgi:hypothetical protein
MQFALAVVVLSLVVIGIKRLIRGSPAGRRALTDAEQGKAARARVIARKARSEAVLGLFVLGVVLGPMALARVARARSLLAEADESPPGLRRHLLLSGVIAVAAIVVWMAILAFLAIRRGG